MRGQNNAQGASDMGALPDVYPGYQTVTDAKVKAKFEKAWGSPLSAKAGLSAAEIIEATAKGKIKALYLIGGNPPVNTDIGHAKEALKALEKLDFLVAQDIFLTETAKLADVVLPGVSFAEKDGTFTNTERRVQRVRKAVGPIGESRADWDIICLVAKKMGGSGFDFKNASQIMDEIVSLTPSYGGISYRRLEKGGLQWPCPTTEHPGTPILHAQQFTRGKGHFIPLSTR